MTHIPKKIARLMKANIEDSRKSCRQGFSTTLNYAPDWGLWTTNGCMAVFYDTKLPKSEPCSFPSDALSAERETLDLTKAEDAGFNADTLGFFEAMVAEVSSSPLKATNVDAANLRQALKLLKPLIAHGQGFGRKKVNSIRLMFESNQLTVRTHDVQTGEGETTFNTLSNTMPFIVSYDWKMIKPILDALDGQLSIAVTLDKEAYETKQTAGTSVWLDSETPEAWVLAMSLHADAPKTEEAR